MLLYCNGSQKTSLCAKNKKARAVPFCSSHAMASSVIYYSTEARKSEIYLLNIICEVNIDIYARKYCRIGNIMYIEHNFEK